MAKTKKNNVPYFALCELTENLVSQLDKLQEWQMANDEIFANDEISDEKAENVLKAFRMLESTFESLIGKSISFQLGKEKYENASRMI